MSHGHDCPHGDTAEFDPDDRTNFTQEFWDERYGSADRLWSGQPNPQLVAQTTDLAPGDALDAGCGEGADAIWLASRGWTVTAVDVSAVALDRASAHAAAEGVSVRWQREDLLTWVPEPDRFDLVTAQFMHLPNREVQSLHAGLAAAVRPGGTLLIVAHHPDDLHVNVGRTGRASLFPSAEQLAAMLDPGSWEVLVATAIGRTATDLDGQPVTVKDTVLRAARRR
jgi:2-polyprenyl-3-methyl-5-hydroxy-6-metoxy-1,4-benzoquinol methylase